jgi:hypothetical protein
MMTSESGTGITRTSESGAGKEKQTGRPYRPLGGSQQGDLPLVAMPPHGDSVNGYLAHIRTEWHPEVWIPDE